MTDFKSTLCDYVMSGHSLLYVDTFEKDRAISEISEMAEDCSRQIYIWSISQGWTDKNGISVSEVKPNAQVENHLKEILEFPESTICILKDFGGYVESTTYPNYDIVIGWLDELSKIIASVRQTIVFVGPEFNIPKTLLHNITKIDFSLPDNNQIADRVAFACSDVTKADGTKFEPDQSIIPQVVDACRGMTCQQTVDRVTLALRKHKDLNQDAIKTISKEKSSIVRASGLLTYIEPPEGGLDNVGGYDALKEHVRLDKPCFSKEARKFGIEFPRGMMLVGIPGCGKTLLSLSIASELELPLIAMDVGNIMNKFIGESEKNMREAIQMIESMSPCVLQLDEIEKGFGGSGDTDGGASRRVFGAFIKWLNDRNSPVYAIATANQVQSLPPEFCRKGRFDEIYGLDIPNYEERKEIFDIHIRKRNRDPKNFDLKALSEATEGYTGADIEQIIKLGLKIAFFNNKELSSSNLQQAAEQIIPLSKTESDRILELRKWCSTHAKQANPTKKSSPPTLGGRKVTLS